MRRVRDQPCTWQPCIRSNCFARQFLAARSEKCCSFPDARVRLPSQRLDDFVITDSLCAECVVGRISFERVPSARSPSNGVKRS